MHEWLMKVYYRSPYPLKVLAATAKGYYLRWWRYGPETARLIQEALERESWSQQKWQAWQAERLAFMLHHAATQVPYYREQWTRRRRQGDQSSWELLENWPILEKEPLRQNPAAFIVDGFNLRHMYYESTSGSTGTPLSLWQSRKTIQAWYALSEVRWRRWHGVSSHDRWAILGGKMISEVRRRTPPFWVWNGGLNQLYMSTYHLAPDLLPHYLEALHHYRITYLWGYTSALHLLAQEVLQSRRKDFPMTVVITNAEPLFDYQRQMIAEAFQCPVRETYGMSEKVAAASECEAGNLHLWPEAGSVEILAPGESQSPANSGDLVCTGLLNEDMPLIRYRIGDRGTFLATGEVCSCGRSLPMLASIDGRLDDTIYTVDGRVMNQQVDTLFDTNMDISESQIIQEALDRFRLRFVPGTKLTAAASREMKEGLQARLGPVEVILEPVNEIPRDANGKFRVVVCNLNDGEKRRVSQMIRVPPEK